MTPYDLRVGCCGTPTGLAKYATIFPARNVGEGLHGSPVAVGTIKVLPY